MNSSITFSNEFSEEEIYEFEAEQIEKSLDLENDCVSYDPKTYQEVDNLLQNSTVGFKSIEGISVKSFDQKEKTKNEKVENKNVKESTNENEKEKENEKDSYKNTRFNFNCEEYLSPEKNNEFQNLDLESDFWFDGCNYEKEQKKEKGGQKEKEIEIENILKKKSVNNFPFNSANLAFLNTLNSSDEEDIIYDEDLISFQSNPNHYEEIISEKQFSEIGEKKLREFPHDYKNDLEFFSEDEITRNEDHFFNQNQLKILANNNLKRRQTNEPTIPFNEYNEANLFFNNEKNDIEIKKEKEKENGGGDGNGNGNGNGDGDGDRKGYGNEYNDGYEYWNEGLDGDGYEFDYVNGIYKEEIDKEIEMGKEKEKNKKIDEYLNKKFDQHFSEMKIENIPGLENEQENRQENKLKKEQENKLKKKEQQKKEQQKKEQQKNEQQKKEKKQQIKQEIKHPKNDQIKQQKNDQIKQQKQQIEEKKQESKHQPKKTKKITRKRVFQEGKSVEVRHEVIESGKELFKLLIGLLWVSSGGASHTTLTPLCEAFVSKISQVLTATNLEEKEFQSQLRYLLSNSRRTFTEYVLEILLGVLSLSVHQSKPRLSVQLKKIIQQIKDIQLNKRKKLQKQKKNQNVNKKKNNKKKNLSEIDNNQNNIEKESASGRGRGKGGQSEKKKKKENEKENENETGNINKMEKEKKAIKRKKKTKKKRKLITYNGNNFNNDDDHQKTINNEETINNDLEKIFPQIFTQPVLMFWFEKRFANRLNYLLTSLDKTRFYQQFLYPLVKSKLITICWKLAREFLKRDGPLKKYCRHISLVYMNNPLNLYSNNRGPKLKLIKQIIVKFGLNNSNYWVKSIDLFQNKHPLSPQIILEKFPFNQIVYSSLFNKIYTDNQGEQSNKKRTLATKNNRVDQNVNVGWILKTSEFGGAPDYNSLI
ncbi:enolase-phosphatase e1 [Anaeramoeba flamelloides]|uniref:Enolase-phosphatase e1 n=1 Tax=Anaeramoeba flamelloides TaxID=1746091 RepID=A0ABQ8YA13_9EUKA|nr:enolase-phosphatase e1 [Anaeramoeba flamelloides]